MAFYDTANRRLCVVKTQATILLLYDVTRCSPDDEFQEFGFV